MFTRSFFYAILPAALMISATNAPAGKAYQSAESDKSQVELSCLLYDNGTRLSNYSIIIYRDDEQSDTLNVDKPKVVYFRLDYNHVYAIRHIAPGYHDRIVMVNTHVDKKTAAKKTVFDYKIEMLSEQEPGNTVYDLPVAQVSFDSLHNKFDYSKKYQQLVKRTPADIASK